MGRQPLLKWKASTGLRTGGAAVAVAVGCFLGAALGVWTRFPGVGTAILFPPYAVLTAALLLSPPRRWWIYLLASAAGNALPHLTSGAVPSFVLVAELANFAKALIAAVGVRAFNRRPDRFDTLSGTLAFLVFAVALGPAVGAVIGAFDVVLHGGPRLFWDVWKAWLASNALTGLTLLPILLVTVGEIGSRRAVKTDRLRAAEAALLFLELFAVSAYLFTGTHGSVGAHPAQLYWPLPFLLWAAVRFGPRGTGVALLSISALTIWGALNARGPFAFESPAENLLQLQLFLITISLPLLLLSALIQQHRLIESALRESREQLRCVVEDQTEMICRFLPDGTYTFVNGAYCRYFQRTAEELIGRTAPNPLPLDLSPERPVVTRETHLPGPDGEERWQQWSDRALFDNHGRILECQSVGRDITERKRAEDEHQQLEAQRQAEVALREADRRKDEFLAMLGHELRNPMAPIGMALELMGQHPSPHHEVRWAQEVIGRQIGQMKRLVDDLLDVSRITYGKLRLQMETVGIQGVVTQAVEMTRPPMKSRRHELTLSLPAEPIQVNGDTVRLVQIVANLLNNATKYTEPGGRIHLAVAREDDDVRITVRDNGIGIAPELLKQVFELFAQAPSNPDGPQGGLGIGLTLAKQLIELHGGEIQARSAGLGQGTEMIVRLPALPSAIVHPALPMLTRSNGEPLRILAVDDNADVAEGLARLLSTWGHEVNTAHNGIAALEAAERFTPDVVLLDLGLPEIDGLEVGRRLRESPQHSGVLLVAMTGFGQAEDVRRSQEAGFDHHLVKPFDTEALRLLFDASARPSPA